MIQSFYNGREGRLTNYNPATGAWTDDQILYLDTSDSISHKPTQPSMGFYRAFEITCRGILAEVNKTAKNKFVFDNSRLQKFDGIGFVQGIADVSGKASNDFAMLLIREDHTGDGVKEVSDADYRFELYASDAIPYFQNGNQGMLFNDSVRRLLELDKKA